MIAFEGVRIEAGAFSLSDVTFNVATGTWCVFMGSTGSGKTTILETLCGLRQPVAGKIVIEGRDVTALHPSIRGIGYVPQDKALFRTMTVRENLAFALKVRRWAETDIARRVEELAGLLRIDGLLDRYPARLSGGEAQRVALGRALAPRPAVLCLDEPLSALDDATRDEMRALLQTVRAQSRVTALHITHHKADAEGLADQLLRLDRGKVSSERLSAG